MRLNPFNRNQVFIFEKGSNIIGKTSDTEKGLKHSSRVTDYSYSGYNQVIRPEVEFALSYEYYDTVGKVQNVVESFVSEILSRDWYYVDKVLEAKKQQEQKKQSATLKKIKQKQMLAMMQGKPAPNVAAEMLKLQIAYESDSPDESPGVKQMEEWETGFALSNLIEYIVRDLLVCGNTIIGATDWQPVQMDSLVGLKRDEFGKVTQYVQQINGKWLPLPLDVKDYIHVKYIDRKRKPWGVGLYHALSTTFLHNSEESVAELDLYRRHIQNTGKIEEKYASPVVIWAYENIDQRTYEQMKVQMDNLQPGDRRITTRKPELITETIDGRSALIASITPIIDKEIEAGLQSSANRLLTEPSAMADAREANDKDDSRSLLMMEKIRRVMNEEVIPRVLGNEGDIEFVWGSQDEFKIEMPPGIVDGIKLGVIAKEEARDILRAQGWKLDDAAFEDQQQQIQQANQQKMQQVSNSKKQKEQLADLEDTRARTYKLLKKKVEQLEDKGL